MRQHSLPVKSYLSGFCSKECPKGLNPCVWVYQVKSRKWIRKSPRHICYEDDIYTFVDDRGDNNYLIENKLKLIEDKILRIIKNKIMKRKLLTNIQKQRMSLFIALMIMRSPEVHNNFKADVSEKQFDKSGLNKEVEVKEGDNRIGENPRILKRAKLKTLFEPAYINSIAEVLLNMSWHILYTDKFNFITSSFPFALINYTTTNNFINDLKNTRLKLFFTLNSRTAIFMSWKEKPDLKYCIAQEWQVKDINLRLSIAAKELIISENNDFFGFVDYQKEIDARQL